VKLTTNQLLSTLRISAVIPVFPELESDRREREGWRKKIGEVVEKWVEAPQNKKEKKIPLFPQHMSLWRAQGFYFALRYLE
jgi:hypothetical protein